MRNSASGQPVTMVTWLDFVRHGEHALGDVLCGRTDPVLSAVGWRQLQQRCDGLVASGVQWDACITSPRQRCQQFAEHFSQQLAIPCRVEDGLAELDFGEWEGLSVDDITARDPALWAAWRADPGRTALPGGEPYTEFLQRTATALINITAHHPGQRLLLFAHGGVMRAVLCYVLQLATASLSHLSVPHACHSGIAVYHNPPHADWYELYCHDAYAPRG